MKNPLHIVVGLVFVLLGTALGFGVHAQALSFLAGCLLVFVALSLPCACRRSCFRRGRSQYE